MLKRSFGEDVALLAQMNEVIVLRNGLAAVAVVPRYQGRVMTSTADGDSGLGFGWINAPAILSKEIQPQINVYGGEDRFWLGPEGSQHSIYFAHGSPFEFSFWQTPAAVDTDPYRLVHQSQDSATFAHECEVHSFSGNHFSVGIERTIRLLSRENIESKLAISIPTDCKFVAYQSENTVSNLGENSWTRESGTISMWIIGMYGPGEQATIIAPFRPEGDGEPVNADYFGKLDERRLKLIHNCVLLKADGTYRSKIGLSPSRTVVYEKGSVVGSFDAQAGVLTIVHYSFNPEETEYVNQLWQVDDSPYGGDVFNGYNDGPTEPGGKPLGPFFEIESSSPALFLDPGQSRTHIHSTVHFRGPIEQLSVVAEKVLGIELAAVVDAFE